MHKTIREKVCESENFQIFECKSDWNITGSYKYLMTVFIHQNLIASDLVETEMGNQPASPLDTFLRIPNNTNNISMLHHRVELRKFKVVKSKHGHIYNI